MFDATISLEEFEKLLKEKLELISDGAFPQSIELIVMGVMMRIENEQRKIEQRKIEQREVKND